MSSKFDHKCVSVTASVSYKYHYRKQVLPVNPLDRPIPKGKKLEKIKKEIIELHKRIHEIKDLDTFNKELLR